MRLTLLLALLFVALTARTVLADRGNGHDKDCGEICPATFCGDVNNDGNVVATDALAVARIAIGLPGRIDDCSVSITVDGVLFQGTAPREDGLDEGGQCFERSEPDCDDESDSDSDSD